MLLSWRALPFSLCAGVLLATGLAASPAFARTPEQAAITSADQAFAEASRRAFQLAAAPYAAPDKELPKPFQNLDYDGYRKLRARPEASVWAKPGNPFAVLPLPRGFFYEEAVTINFIQRDGTRRPYSSADAVDFVDYPAATDADRMKLGSSGWRAITRPGIAGEGYEFAVVQGGSYFRAVGQGQFYGVSARALAIATGSAAGEEFPRFTEFWIFEPAATDESLTFVALADSRSVASAYRFTLRPGSDTTIDVAAEIHPRTDISEAGVAPLSSMYLHGTHDPRDAGDNRPEVHDSDGLAILTASGEHIWRPLANPSHVQMSSFSSPMTAFGLEQRHRDPAAYADGEAKYELRPSIWIEPQGDWGPGGIYLLEIPTINEYADNVAAFWRPAQPWRAGSVQRLAYRLHWTREAQPNATVAKVVATHVGPAPESKRVQRIVIDFTGDAAFAAKDLSPDVWSTAGAISNIQISALPAGRRLSFDLDPGAAQVVELHAALADKISQQTETWLFRWTPE
jgi:glucans biosynthesis protein